MATTINAEVYTNSDDAFVAWKLSDFIPGCRGFQLERGRKVPGGPDVTETVENRVGFEADKPKSGEHHPSDFWPFQRFNWTDHAVDVGREVRYRVTAMIDSGGGRPFAAGPASAWTPWTKLTPDAGDGFSCFFNRGLILSQFVARYLKDKKITPAKLKSNLKNKVDPKFRAFLFGDLGARVNQMLADAASTAGAKVHAALYELGDGELEDGLIKLGSKLKLILANGSASPDGNQKARKHLNDKGIKTIDRMLGSRGLGHNKFVVFSDSTGAKAVWTGSTNWSTTGLCTQINNGLLIEDRNVADLYQKYWDELRNATPAPPAKADWPAALMTHNDKLNNLKVNGHDVTVRFTRTSDQRDMDELRKVIRDAGKALLFLMFTPGGKGLHFDAAARAGEKNMYVRGVISSLGTTKADNELNVLDVQLVSDHDDFQPDYYTAVQPQGIGKAFGSWIAEVTRKDFLNQVGHAIVHSKIIVADPLGNNPVVVTGSHNFSTNASKKNDENYVIVRGHKPLARAYATHIMSVYQHYRWRSYLREMAAKHQSPWSYLDDDDKWLKSELKSKADEIDYWA